MTIRKKKRFNYTLDIDVEAAIKKAAALEGKSASRFIEDTMRERSTAILAKHAQDKALSNSSNQSLNKE